ncbi:hypothetical protein Q8A73_000279 [Channa argus]|nr:hypothetical protein Q8A73_000279 [Channa argus]
MAPKSQTPVYKVSRARCSFTFIEGVDPLCQLDWCKGRLLVPRERIGAVGAKVDWFPGLDAGSMRTGYKKPWSPILDEVYNTSASSVSDSLVDVKNTGVNAKKQPPTSVLSTGARICNQLLFELLPLTLQLFGAEEEEEEEEEEEGWWARGEETHRGGEQEDLDSHYHSGSRCLLLSSPSSPLAESRFGFGGSLGTETGSVERKTPNRSSIHQTGGSGGGSNVHGLSRSALGLPSRCCPVKKHRPTPAPAATDVMCWRAGLEITGGQWGRAAFWAVRRLRSSAPLMRGSAAAVWRQRFASNTPHKRTHVMSWCGGGGLDRAPCSCAHTPCSQRNMVTRDTSCICNSACARTRDLLICAIPTTIIIITASISTCMLTDSPQAPRLQAVCLSVCLRGRPE